METNEILRKLIHITFSAVLLIPLALPPLIDPAMIYAGALALGGWIYSMQVKGPPQWLKTSMQIPQPKGIEVVLDSFNHLVRLVERDYERRVGWLGALSGLVGVSSTYFLFGLLASYGILALILTDGISSIVGILLGKIRIPLSDGTVEGTLAGFLSYYAVLTYLTGIPQLALVIAAASSIAELYGGEDNISIPVISTLTAFLIGAPSIQLP